MLCPASASARPAPPDRPFGGRDGVVHPVPGLESAGNAVAVLRSGRIVAAGSSRRRAGESFVIVRLGRRGRLERRRYVRFPQAPYSGAVDLALTRGGRILVAGLARDELGVGRIALAALRPSLRPDPRFGTAGRALGPPVDDTLGVEAMAVDRAGGILVLSTGGDEDRVRVTRFLANGSLDPRFGTGGSWTSAQRASARAISVARDGEILVAGRPGRTGVVRPAFLFARLSPRGVQRSVDVRRLGRGVAGTGPAAIVARRDGSAWVAGTLSESRGRSRPVLLRYGRSGRLDRRFGRGGVRRLGRRKGRFTMAGMIRRPGGRLLIGGQRRSDAFTFSGLTRGGRLDPRVGEQTRSGLAQYAQPFLRDFATRGRRIVAVGTDEDDQRIDFYTYFMVAAIRIVASRAR